MFVRFPAEDGQAMHSMKRDVLRRLGAGESIESICHSTGWTRAEFDTWWQREAASRAPRCAGQVVVAVRSKATIERDGWGIPHIFAESQHDLWFAFGFAMAQDRLFQMDYLRRKGLGRLAEVLGADGLPLDLVARTVGLNRIAQAEWSRLPSETRNVLEAFAAGVSAWIDQCGEQLPIEFDLLDYRPEPWTPVDSLAIESEFRWYLTGRFPVIVMPEMAKRVLGDGPLYRDFLLGEEDQETIVPPEAYRDLKRRLGTGDWPGLTDRPREDVGQATGDPEGTGSNNWVVAGRHCRSGMPLVASDPHIAFEAVSCWYEAHLCGGGFNVAGMAYVGMPAIMFGRNEHVAWGITNNICSQRDLYQEQTDSAHPNCFQFDGRWELARELVETIQVKGAEPVSRTIRFSRSGPVVNEILPLSGQQTGPVTLKWLGAYQGGWLTALLAIDRAPSVAEFRAALRPWHVPTFNLVVADIQGQIAVQCAGRIPLRKYSQRGYRSGSDPDQQWIGLLPFDAMPHAIDPPRGWLATANNRLAGDDYPYPLSGTWPSGYRAKRIRELIEAKLAATAGAAAEIGFTGDDFRVMHQDALSLRAVDCVPPLLAALAEISDRELQAAADLLRKWDGRSLANLVAPTLFNVFFTFWSKAVAEERFEGVTAELLAKQAEGIASRLLADDPLGWFPSGQRVPRIRRVFRDTLAYLTQRLGPDMASWQWGRLHRLPLKHVLSNRGDLGQLLDHGGVPVNGDMTTVCNTGNDPNWQATSGAGYRLIADLATNCLLAVDAQSQSGHPGSLHYSDQLAAWSGGEYHVLPLNRDDVSQLIVEKLQLCSPQ
jgi:penicillin G amidase